MAGTLALEVPPLPHIENALPIERLEFVITNSSYYILGCFFFIFFFPSFLALPLSHILFVDLASPESRFFLLT